MPSDDDKGPLNRLLKSRSFVKRNDSQNQKGGDEKKKSKKKMGVQYDKLPNKRDRKIVLKLLESVLQNSLDMEQESKKELLNIISNKSSIMNLGLLGGSVSKPSPSSSNSISKEERGNGDEGKEKRLETGDVKTNSKDIMEEESKPLSSKEGEPERSLASATSAKKKITKSEEKLLSFERHCRRSEEFRRIFLRQAADLLMFSRDDYLDDGNDEKQVSSSEEGFRCLALFLFRFLLSCGKYDPDDESGDGSSTIVGYDARVRTAFRIVAVQLLSPSSSSEKVNEGALTAPEERQGGEKSVGSKEDNYEVSENVLPKPLESVKEEKEDDGSTSTKKKKQEEDALKEQKKNAKAIAILKQCQAKTKQTRSATRKFECLEHTIATKLLFLSKQQQTDGRTKDTNNNENPNSNSTKPSQTSQKMLVRGFKIGAAGIAAGTLLAVTGGMAAPAIAAGVAAVAGGTAIAGAAAMVLASSTAVMTIFGVGGGGLMAYKMNKRTCGLTEFTIKKHEDVVLEEEQEKAEEETPDLSLTIGISGWLKDRNGFEQPWGAATPTNPYSKLELLERFCSIYSPDKVPLCPQILKQWKGKEEDLWKALRNVYGRDPDTLLPLMDGPRRMEVVTEEEEKVVDDLIECLGFQRPSARKNRTSQQQFPINNKPKDEESVDFIFGNASKEDMKHDDDNDATKSDSDHMFNPSSSSSRHLRSVRAWDFHSKYGGELYSVTWESKLLMKISNAVKDLTVTLAKKSAMHTLKYTTLATLLSAISLPSAIISAFDIIDQPWTLAMERSEEAGIELAKCLLEGQRGGFRPVNLVGFSFGSNVILGCLKELVRCQKVWEKEEEERRNKVLKGEENDSSGEGATSWTKKPFAQEAKTTSFSREPAGIVGDVVIMGCPESPSASTWISIRQIVSGRIVNCYAHDDWILNIMFRMKNFHKAHLFLCGTNPVNIGGIENYNVSPLLSRGSAGDVGGGSGGSSVTLGSSNHADYGVAVNDILSVLGFGQDLKA